MRETSGSEAHVITRSRISILFAVALLYAAVDIPQAHAALAVSGFLTMRSDDGDYIGQGESYRFPARALTMDPIQDGISIGVQTNDRWGLSFVAPTAPSRQPRRLHKGVYRSTQRFADVLHPGLDVGGAGRGCNESNGRFTVTAIRYGPHGYVRSFHATFEQHCEHFGPALRGEVLIRTPAPPPRLHVQLVFDPERTSLGADGIQLEGTMSCTQDVDTASVTAQVSESFAGGAIGSGNAGLAKCGSKPTQWQMTAGSSNGVPFTANEVRVTLEGGATDPFYTELNGGTPINAHDQLPTRKVAVRGGTEPSDAKSSADGTSNRPSWWLFIGVVIVATVGWSFLLADWIHRRRNHPTQPQL
jgi:hypothetical protein